MVKDEHLFCARLFFFTGNLSTCSFDVVVNLDGIFDEKDSISHLNLYCITSPISFSCGNIVPALLKESGKVTLIGAITGGGACAVQTGVAADRTIFNFSSSMRISVVCNGSYCTVDRGIEPHYHLSKMESYYDRVGLTEYINHLK